MREAEYHTDYANLGNGGNTDHVILNLAANDAVKMRLQMLQH